jgi:predicted 3-demethylubiquinone-9 3-methyltransferase (glyoxalase superfamily)
MVAPKITPCLWFDDNCEEAVNYYIKTFNDSPHKQGPSKIVELMRYEKGIKAPDADKMEGKILTVIFDLDGVRFMALDGGPAFKQTEAVSFQIECEDQEEVDYFQDKLSAVPESNICGWVKDQFGTSWQITPKRLNDLVMDPDRAKAHRVFNAMLEMKKIIIADLEKAAAGKE